MRYIAALFLLLFGAESYSSGKDPAFRQDTIYSTSSMIVTALSDHVYQHTTFLQTNTFGRVSCNGMVVIDKGEAIVFDTPADDAGSDELLDFLTRKKNLTVKAVISTHFHTDCTGGLAAFHARNIPSYARKLTIELAKKARFPVPRNGFNKNLRLRAGSTVITAEFFGEGHTKDNVIGYFADENTMFGGCLIKELNATKGNLADANTDAWSATVSAIRKKYPEVRKVIPGHGITGGIELLDYTIGLFAK